ncbi:class I adenylate-forming enzyme family protein [Candidatus Pseudothioglobus singularis]|nr:class I adenylate-forming enzyme family protein [Candidatus Pseudothioglobus singularis]
MSNYSFISILSAKVQTCPDEIFCKEINGNSITFKELDKLSSAVSRLLIEDYSIKKGEVISIQFGNSIVFIIYFIAIIRSGCIVNPIPLSATEFEVNSILENLKGKLIITQNLFNDKKYCSVLHQSSDFNNIKIKLQKFDCSFINYEQIKSITCIFLSSGSSGIAPKGIAHSNEVLIKTALNFSSRLNFSSDSMHLAFLPCGNTSFIGHSFLPMLVMGGCLLIAPNFISISRKIWNIIDENKVDFVQVVPAIADAMRKNYPNSFSTNKRILKYVSSGSAPLSVKQQDEFFKTTSIDLVNTYGLSETGAIFFNLPGKNNYDMYSIGTPMQNVEVKINNVGELLVKSDTLFCGYYSNGKLNSDIKNDDGYFKTGDIISFNNNQYYYIGRVDNLLIRAGVNISSEEIEAIILEIGVTCIILSLSNDSFGNVLTCVYENDKQSALIEEKISMICKEKLTTIKCPTNFLHSANFPKTPTGKIKRNMLIKEIINRSKV